MATVHRVARMSIPRKAQEDVAQAQPHVPAGEFRCWRMEINICLALKDMGRVQQYVLNSVRPGLARRGRVSDRARVIAT